MRIDYDVDDVNSPMVAQNRVTLALTSVKSLNDSRKKTIRESRSSSSTYSCRYLPRSNSVLRSSLPFPPHARLIYFWPNARREPAHSCRTATTSNNKKTSTST